MHLINLAEKELRFLVNELGYNIKVRMDDRLLRYESKKVYIQIMYDPYSFELGLKIGLIASKGEEERPFSLQEVMQLAHDTPQSLPDTYQATTIGDMKTTLIKFSDLLKRYGIKALQGEKSFFEALAKTRTRNFEELQNKWNRQHLEKAWKEKNYSKAIELLEQIDTRTKSEQKKLILAKKLISQ